MSQWWFGIRAAEVSVPCGDQAHTVRWEAGQLKAVDHGEVDGERALAALAGANVACLDLLRAWSACAEDPHVLTLASRGLADPLDIDRRGLRFHSDGPRRETEEQTVALLGTSNHLADRLAATTAAIWTERLSTGHPALETVQPELDAALYGRVLRTLRGWLGEPQLGVELTMIGPEETPRVIRTADGVHARLPFGWLSDVWMRGLAVTFGQMCIAAETADGSAWTLQTLGPDLTDRVELTVVVRPEPDRLTSPRT